MDDDGIIINQQDNRMRKRALVFASLILFFIFISTFFHSFEPIKIFPEQYYDSEGRVRVHKGDYFEITAPAIRLKYGETWANTVLDENWVNQFPLPQIIQQKFNDSDIIITGFEGNFVRISNGKEYPVSSNQFYNHHYTVYLLTNQLCKYKANNSDPIALPNVDFHALLDTPENNGGEWRRTFHGYEDGLGQVVRSPTCFMIVAHVINTIIPNGIPKAAAIPKSSTAPLTSNYNGITECPCTTARDIDRSKGTIDGEPLELYCRPSSDLSFQKNPACSPQTYDGGAACCGDHARILDKDQIELFNSVDEVHYKFRFYYRSKIASDQNAYKMILVTGSQEYDIPACKTGEHCIHTNIDTYKLNEVFRDCDINIDVWPFCTPIKPLKEGNVFRIVYIAAHMHIGVVDAELVNKRTGQVICRSMPQYGAGGNAVSDEKDYLVAVPPCIYNATHGPVFDLDTIVTSIFRYNSSIKHYGVMAHWAMRGIYADQ